MIYFVSSEKKEDILCLLCSENPKLCNKLVIFLIYWQVVFTLIMFRPFVGEIITAKVIDSTADGLRCKSSTVIIMTGCCLFLSSLLYFSVSPWSKEFTLYMQFRAAYSLIHFCWSIFRFLMCKCCTEVCIVRVTCTVETQIWTISNFFLIFWFWICKWQYHWDFLMIFIYLVIVFLHHHTKRIAQKSRCRFIICRSDWIIYRALNAA